jgi:hypothetical protein
MEGIVWVIGTTASGDTVDFGYPNSEPLWRALQDQQHFVSIEIVGYDRP